MMRIRLIHGIHSKDGDNNMSALLPHIRALFPNDEVSLFSYGFMGFWAARWKNDSVAKELADIHLENRDYRDNEVWITHSNGAAVAYLACTRYHSCPDMVININPALDRHIAVDTMVEVIHSKGDRWVYLSRFLPFHLWGDQGRVGYKGKRSDVVNHNASSPDFGDMAYEGHTELFEPHRIERWAWFIAERIDARLRSPS